MGAIKKAGVEFYAKIDTNRDLIGAADQFSAEVIVDTTGDVLTDDSANASIGAFVEVGETGIYRAPITLTDEGDYTISVKWTDGTSTEYIPFPVEVKAADMTDIKDLIDALQTDMTSVKEQIDVLDEAELNGISEQVTSVNESVEYIKELISDVTTTVTVAGDATAAFTEDGKVVGKTSGAEGVVSVATYDADADVTTVTLSNTKGVFEVEDVTATDGSTQTLTSTTVAGSAVDSVMEFVNALNDSIADGNDSLNVIKTYTDNLELMLEGKEYTDTEGNVVSADDSKGLAEIYTEITANGVSIADANTAIANLDTKVGDIQTSVEGKIADVQAAVDALTDADNADSLVSKVNAIKTVVDANSDVLTDAGYGLEALKGLIDTANSSIDDLVADWADGGRLEVRFDTLDSTLSDLDTAVNNAKTAIQDDIANLSSSLDDKYAALDSKLDSIAGAQQYKGFV